MATSTSSSSDSPTSSSKARLASSHAAYVSGRSLRSRWQSCRQGSRGSVGRSPGARPETSSSISRNGLAFSGGEKGLFGLVGGDAAQLASGGERKRSVLERVAQRRQMLQRFGDPHPLACRVRLVTE